MEYGKYKAKKTFYRGIWFDSNLEARVAEALDDLGYRWKFHEHALRDKQFPYGQYTPDFLLEDGRFVEVFGVFEERHQQNTYVVTHVLRSKAHRPTLLLVDGDGNTTEWYAYTQDGQEYVTCRKSDTWNGHSNIFEAASKA